MRNLPYAGLLVAAIMGLSLPPAAFAQDVIDWIPAGPGNWNANANWIGPAGNFVPDITLADEVARIATGGTAQVLSGDDPPAVGGINIVNGTVEVTAGGMLTSQANANANEASTGEVNISPNGTLIVAGTMTLAEVLQDDDQTVASSLVSTGTIRTVGPTSALGIAGNLNHGSPFIAELTSATHGAVNVTGNATLGGAFIADFNGATPANGATWDIITAGSFTGGFTSVSVTGTTLPPGRIAFLQQPSATLQLAVEQRLVLTFNRETGDATLTNPTTSPISFAIDGYSIESVNGGLNPAGWNSFEDQGFEGNTWFETGTGGAINALAELNPTTSGTLGPSQSRTIGSIYSPNFSNVDFGEEYEDHVFTYHMADRTEEAVVIYEGDKQENNIVLTVDPTTGDAAMQNESEISVSFDSYTIFSETGDLLPTWDSLDDQNAIEGAWLEANPSTNRLSEVMSEGVTTMYQNQGFYLDGLFNIGGAQDLSFQFLIAGTTTVFDGVVEFGDLPTNVTPPGPLFNEADFDQDGDVDGDDFLRWQGGFGTPAGAVKLDGDYDNDGDVDGDDFLGWQANFGFQGGNGSSAVPEPTSLVLLLAAAVGLVAWKRR